MLRLVTITKWLCSFWSYALIGYATEQPPFIYIILLASGFPLYLKTHRCAPTRRRSKQPRLNTDRGPEEPSVLRVSLIHDGPAEDRTHGVIHTYITQISVILTTDSARHFFCDKAVIRTSAGCQSERSEEHTSELQSQR